MLLVVFCWWPQEAVEFDCCFVFLTCGHDRPLQRMNVFFLIAAMGIDRRPLHRMLAVPFVGFFLLCHNRYLHQLTDHTSTNVGKDLVAQDTPTRQSLLTAQNHWLRLHHSPSQWRICQSPRTRHACMDHTLMQQTMVGGRHCSRSSNQSVFQASQSVRSANCPWIPTTVCWALPNNHRCQTTHIHVLRQPRCHKMNQQLPTPTSQPQPHLVWWVWPIPCHSPHSPIATQLYHQVYPYTQTPRPTSPKQTTLSWSLT